jgi:hypothetical protein
MNIRLLPLFLFLLTLIALSGFLYSVTIPASPMPLTSPTFSLNSANGFYARSARLFLSGTDVTYVQVIVYNDLTSDRTATVTVQIYDWNGNLISGGSVTSGVPGQSIATVTVTLSPPVPYSSVGTVVVDVG